LKILTLGGNFPVDGLRAQGHEVMAFASGFASPHALNIPTDFFLKLATLKDRIAQAIETFSPDWLLQIDDSSPLVHFAIEEIRIPKAWYAIDTHIHLGWHPHYAALFDLVFCAQKNHLEVMQKYQPRTVWMPTFYTGIPEFLLWDERKYDVSFVGTLDAAINPRRLALLDSLQKLGCEINIQQGSYHPIYCDSRIVINQSSADDLNFRFFEAMGCGALLITDRISHSLFELGKPGRDFLLYEPDDAEDLLNKIRWAQNHPLESEAIAKRGHNLILSQHMAAHRADSLVSAFTLNKSVKTFAPQYGLAQLSWVMAYISRLNLPEFLIHFFTQEASRHAIAVEEISHGNPWACIVLSRLAIEQGNEQEALAYLSRIETVPDDPILRKPYFFMQALLWAYSGDFLRAKQKLVMGIKEFPHDPELVQFYDFLKSKEGES
jgi:Glycosyl transferases group 1